MYTATYKSPVGLLKITATKNGISSIMFSDEEEETTPATTDINPCIRQLEEYFAGERQEFTLPIDISGTPFRQKAWKALQDIDFGTTKTYSEVARTVRRPKASRAIGNAIHYNPLSIIIPCHRVIGKDGSLTGFAGGLWRKEWLLTHEQKCLAASRKASKAA